MATKPFKKIPLSVRPSRKKDCAMASRALATCSWFYLVHAFEPLSPSRTSLAGERRNKIVQNLQIVFWFLVFPLRMYIE